MKMQKHTRCSVHTRPSQRRQVHLPPSFWFLLNFTAVDQPNCSVLLQDKEIYRWPIKESIKAMIAWEWNIDKAREEEESDKKKAAARKISQTAQVRKGPE